MSTIGQIRVTPLRRGKTGFDECEEEQAEFFSLTKYSVESSYGEGWFPLYDFGIITKADFLSYMYRDLNKATKAMKEYLNDT